MHCFIVFIHSFFLTFLKTSFSSSSSCRSSSSSSSSSSSLPFPYSLPSSSSASCYSFFPTPALSSFIFFFCSFLFFVFFSSCSWAVFLHLSRQFHLFYVVQHCCFVKFTFYFFKRVLCLLVLFLFLLHLSKDLHLSEDL